MSVSGYDAYVECLEDEKVMAVWFATLSNGQVVYQDDFRPGQTPPKAWDRLATYVAGSGLSITNLGMQFRTHVIHNIVPPNAQGYYYRGAALRSIDTPNTINLVLVGALVDGVLDVETWHTPELILFDQETRDPSESEGSLILNP